MVKVRTGQIAMLAASLMLPGCVSPSRLQSEEAKTKADFQHMRIEQQERDNYAACVNQGAMPGSAENLACQLQLEEKQQQSAKPQSPPSP